MQFFSKRFLSTASSNPWVIVQIGNNDWQDVIFAKDIYIAVGYYGAMAYSYNGYEWTQNNFGSQDWLSICYDDSNDKFVIVGENCNTANSTDGINWTSHNITSSTYYYLASVDASPGNPYVVAVGDSGCYTVSQNGGNTWTTLKKISSNSSYKKTLRAIKASSGNFFAVGDDYIVASYTAGSSSWHTPYIAVSGTTDQSLNGIVTPGYIGLPTGYYTIDDYGYLYYSVSNHSSTTGDYTPEFDTDHRVQLPNVGLTAIAKDTIATEKANRLFIGNTSGALTVVSTAESVPSVVKTEQVLTNSYINAVAYNSGEIVLAGNNGYLAYKQSI